MSLQDIYYYCVENIYKFVDFIKFLINWIWTVNLFTIFEFIFYIVIVGVSIYSIIYIIECILKFFKK